MIRGGITSLLLVIWFIIGAVAGGQRHDYSSAAAHCATAATIVVTILAGPLNYIGVDPKISSCKLPKPSS